MIAILRGPLAPGYFLCHIAPRFAFRAMLRDLPNRRRNQVFGTPIAS